MTSVRSCHIYPCCCTCYYIMEQEYPHNVGGENVLSGYVTIMVMIM